MTARKSTGGSGKRKRASSAGGSRKRKNASTAGDEKPARQRKSTGAAKSKTSKTSRAKSTRRKKASAPPPVPPEPLREDVALPPAGPAPDVDDPTRFAPTIGDVDLHLLAEGTHERLDEVLGAHVRTVDGTRGVSFAVWAPNARRVSVVGSFCGWRGDRFPLRRVGDTGVWERFVPGLEPGALYKYELETAGGQVVQKTDPIGFWTEQPPGHASVVVGASEHVWGDAEWMEARARANPRREPLSIYEVHIGSWARGVDEPGKQLGFRAIAPHLAEHVRKLGFTHVELMPVMEHPFGGSWGYQVTGYFAPTSRWGTPDDLRFLVDTLHQAGIGVILDWVPAHFPADGHALYRFDGTALYEHEDPRQGRHPDWDTHIFNYGRFEVANFLLASALHWLREYHVDGLRVDAVASMLYLDYSRPEGEWIPNEHGGRENLAAIELLRRVNGVVLRDFPGCIVVAEESTTWPGVTRDVEHGGLGFHFKWNMGWMHDTLEYFSVDPLFRPGSHDKLTFGMLYEHSEHFLMPLSHDEVVHGKGSLFGKMVGDERQRLANLRVLLAFQFTRPGKQLLFMGSELGSAREWDHDSSLDWHLAEGDREPLTRYVAALGALYRECPAFWRSDPDEDGFRWIECEDRDRSVLAYLRKSGTEHMVVVLNLTPVARKEYRIGVPGEGHYLQVLCSDDRDFGGAGSPTIHEIDVEEKPWHEMPRSMRLDLPPLSALVLEPRG